LALVTAGAPLPRSAGPAVSVLPRPGREQEFGPPPCFTSSACFSLVRAVQPSIVSIASTKGFSFAIVGANQATDRGLPFL